jgi:ATP-binding protein involved in chromosome partitioning
MNDTINHTIESLVIPSQQQTLKELGVTCQVNLQNDIIKIELNAGFPLSLIETEIDAAIGGIARELGQHGQIKLMYTSQIRPHLCQLPGQMLKGVKNTIAVASGKGGVGKSTVSVNLACALAKRGARVGILDADIYGPSLPTMLGGRQPVTLDGDFYQPIVAHGVQAMSMGYLSHDEQALIWRGPMLAKALVQMLNITQWDNLDYLIIDLPPGTGDIQLSLVQKIPLAGAIVVSTPQNVALADVQKALNMFTKTNIPLLGVVENMSIHTCSACGHQEAIFGEQGLGELSQQYQVPILAKLPLDKSIQSDCDKGHPTALKENPLADQFLALATNVCLQLSRRPLGYQDRMPPVVQG